MTTSAVLMAAVAAVVGDNCYNGDDGSCVYGGGDDGGCVDGDSSGDGDSDGSGEATKTTVATSMAVGGNTTIN